MTKIKICGCRTPADIQHAAEAGADFVGMVVAENTKRYVPTEIVHLWLRPLVNLISPWCVS